MPSPPTWTPSVSGASGARAQRGPRALLQGPPLNPPRCATPAAEDLLVPQQGSEDLFLAREDSLHSTDLFLPAFETSEVRAGGRRRPHCPQQPAIGVWQPRTPPASPLPAGHVFLLLGWLGRELPVSAIAPPMLPGPHSARPAAPGSSLATCLTAPGPPSPSPLQPGGPRRRLPPALR